MRKKRFVRLLLILMLIAGLGVGIGALIPREPLLLERATLIANTTPWYGGEHFNRGIGIHWLSDEELLVCRFEGTDSHERILYRHNIRTGREEKLPGLTQARDALFAENVDDECVSPDGRWFLCSGRWESCLLAEVDGKRYTLSESADDSRYRSCYWMADSRYWLEGYHNGGETSRLILHDVEHPDFKESIPVGKNSEVFGALRAVLSRQDAITAIDADPDTADELGSDTPANGSPRTFVLSRISLDTPTSPHVQFRLTMPPGSSPYRLQVSPHGDRLAWSATTQHENATRKWLHRLLPFLKVQVQPRAEIWACDLNGAHMHLIGSLILRPDDDSDTLSHLRWLPDGKRLSFEYNNSLYTVPAE